MRNKVINYFFPDKKSYLNYAADLVEKGWTQGTMARTARDWPVVANDPDAVSWCAAGAIQKAVHDLPTLFPNIMEEKLGESILEFIDGYSIWNWNDGCRQTQQEVVETFRKAASK